ncbi:TIGR03986 family CRISPR-associated RAMP protein [Haliscomenobacter sp.]|uniref:TIGR03986 family type III CRISPR-associated RAMP protein n=1 Tax=Haliscomenobacter sp. TaxID=2717303 RepID=UPI003593A246
MSILKAPYNFVPLSNQVVYPEWAEQVSLDIPFEDAQSGEIEVELKAHSPIFVRDGQGKGSIDHSSDFFQHQGKYYLPGSSLKGMVRSVLEIMSFGKMGDRVNDDRYAIRDLSGTIKELYLSKFKPDTVYGGWLKKNADGTYSLEDCGHPGRISHQHLDEMYNTDFSTYFLKGNGFDQSKDAQKAARFKYRRFEQLAQGQSRVNRFSFAANSAGRPIYEIDRDNPAALPGEIVFTGQPSPRFQRPTGKWEGHHLEFIFFKPDRNVVHTVDPEVINNFFFAYFDQDPSRWSEDWRFWRNELSPKEKNQKGKAIPVFFHKDNQGKVIAIGLSYLFKLPYQKSIRQAMPAQHTEGHKPDFADLLFGFVNGESALESLKGRVHFGHAAAQAGCVPGKMVEVVLSSPKASYYPTYVLQTVDANGKTGSYKTFMDEGAQVAGWKRYPVHLEGVKSNDIPPKSSGDVGVRFVPLETGARFKFTIRYHNLKKVELGALLSALTFHRFDQDTFHGLGMAKPLGYGKVKLSLPALSKAELECLAIYEVYMGSKIKGWLSSPQLKELLSMALEPTREVDSSLVYMKLELGKGNEFTAAKNASEALKPYSKRSNNPIELQSILSKEQLDSALILKQASKLSTQYVPARSSDDIRNELQLRFYQALEEHKANLLAQLEQRKEDIRLKEKAIANEAKGEDARQKGADFSTLVIGSRDFFEGMKKIVRQFVETIHQGKYDKLLKEMPQGVLPEAYHDALIDILQKHCASAAKAERENWQRPYGQNANLKKVAEWIGEEKGKKITFSNP